jgi:serine/threonine-protein kinase
MPNGSHESVIQGRLVLNRVQECIVLYGICAGMRYLQDEMKVVHRYLKPANVLLNANLEPVIADFGLAKQIDGSEMRQTAIAGSPIYMAREFHQNLPYTPAVDVYAFGMLAFEVLSRSLAFVEIKSVPGIVELVLSEKRPPIRSVPREMRPLVELCWAQLPRDRTSFRSLQTWLGKRENW